MIYLKYVKIMFLFMALFYSIIERQYLIVIAVIMMILICLLGIVNRENLPSYTKRKIFYTKMSLISLNLVLLTNIGWSFSYKEMITIIMGKIYGDEKPSLED